MLKQQIESQLREALKAGQKELLETLRFLLSAVKNYEIETQREATDEDVAAVVQKQVKQHKESIEAFQKANRNELVEKEQKELEVLLQYVPKQLSEEEVRVIVEEAVNSLPEADKKNFGKVMGMTMARVKGKADGNVVGRIVKSYLISKDPNKQISNQ